MTLLCSIDEPRFDNGKTEYLMWFADVLQHHAGHGLIGMLLHVLEEVCRLPATEAFQFDNTLAATMWGWPSGFLRQNQKTQYHRASDVVYITYHVRDARSSGIILPGVAG